MNTFLKVSIMRSGRFSELSSSFKLIHSILAMSTSSRAEGFSRSKVLTGFKQTDPLVSLKDKQERINLMVQLKLGTTKGSNWSLIINGLLLLKSSLSYSIPPVQRLLTLLCSIATIGIDLTSNTYKSLYKIRRSQRQRH